MATEPGADKSITPRALTVLIASPEEVRPERELIENVIRDLNQVWIRTFNIYLDLVKWESKPFGPGVHVDSDPSREKPSANDYNIFVGLLWGHFHAPPPSWVGAGTVKEFERAYESFYYKHTCECLFFFKDAEGPPLQNLEAQAKVDDFRASLGNPTIWRRLLAWVRGQSPGASSTFYYGFDNGDQLAPLFRDGLARVVEVIVTGKSSTPEKPKPAEAAPQLARLRRTARLVLDRFLNSMWLVITIVIVSILTGIAALVLEDLLPGQSIVDEIAQIVGYVIVIGLIGLLIWRLGGWGSKSSSRDADDEERLEESRGNSASPE